MYDSDSSVTSEGSDSDNWSYDLEYEPEEQSLTKYNIVLCEKNNEHYLVLDRLKIFNYDEICDIYRNIFINSDVRIELAECIYLPSQECVGILKTFWLKLIQRTWKNIFKERKYIIKERSKLSSLRYREINGKWPQNCSYYPQYNGSLNYLS